jgi:hypothetical protein
VNPAGIVIGIAGLWVVCQVFGGNALERLGVLGDAQGAKADVPGAIAGGAAPFLPGGDRNPPALDWGSLFPSSIGGGKYL